MAILESIGLLLYIIILLGALIIVPLGFPGTWLMVIAAFVFSLLGDFQPGKSDFWVLCFVVLMAATGEVIEYMVGIMGSKKFQVTGGAIACSIVGGLIGAFVGIPVAVIGSLLGLLVGTFLGAWLYEMILNRDIKKSIQMACAVFFSRVMALFVKTTIAFAMVVFILIKSV